MTFLFKPFRWMLRIVAVLGMVVLLFRCTRRAKTMDGLEAWLEHAFPGRFVVLQTNLADPIKNLSFKVKNSIVAERSDSLVQIQLKWDKRMSDLGLAQSEVGQLAERAQKQIKEVKELGDLLEKAGLTSFAYCTHLSDVVVLLFVEPTSQNRLNSLKTLEKAIKQWPEGAYYSLSLFLIKPQRHDEVRLNGIFGMDHWINYEHELLKKSTVYVRALDMGQGFMASMLNKEWELCLDNDELTELMFSHKTTAASWGKTHIKKPFIVMDLLEFENLKDGLGVKVKYPFSFDAVESSESTIHGYICADYVLDDDSHEELCRWRIEMETEEKQTQ